MVNFQERSKTRRVVIFLGAVAFIGFAVLIMKGPSNPDASSSASSADTSMIVIQPNGTSDSGMVVTHPDIAEAMIVMHSRSVSSMPKSALAPSQ